MADSVSSINSLASGSMMSTLAVAMSQASANAQPSGSGPPASAAPATPAAPKVSASGQTLSSPDAPSATPAKPADPLAVETAKELGTAIKSLQDYIKPQQIATLQVDHATGESFVKIVNAQTKQLILQIPSAQVLAMAHKLQELDSNQAAAGVLVDQRG